MRPGIHGKLGIFKRTNAAIALRNALHAEERGRAPSIQLLPRHRQVGAAACSRGAEIVHDGSTGFPCVCPMISCAVKLIPQVGKALPTKKLSD